LKAGWRRQWESAWGKSAAGHRDMGQGRATEGQKSSMLSPWSSEELSDILELNYAPLCQTAVEFAGKPQPSDVFPLNSFKG